MSAAAEEVDAISGISSMAMRLALAEMASAYERQRARHVTIVSVGGVEAARRVREGEAFDFVVLAADAVEQLAAIGRVDRTTQIDLARSGIAIAVRRGAPRPAIGSESAVRDAVLGARIVGLSTGPSGVHLNRLFERWGIADTIAPRLVQAPPGVSIGTLIASGAVEIGFQQLSELLHVPGIDVITDLPPGVQSVTVFSGAVCVASNRRAHANALLSFLASPDNDAVKRRHGMEPARSERHHPMP